MPLRQVLMTWLAGSLIAGLLAGCTPATITADAEYEGFIHAMREVRVRELQRPDGLLSNAASGRLEAGRHSLGSRRGNRILLPQGDAHAGWIEVDGSVAHFIDMAQHRHPLTIGAPGGADPTRVPIGGGSFFLISNGGNLGWRYRDPAAVERHAFRGFDYFPIQSGWRVQARWIDYGELRPRLVMTSNGGVLEMETPGEARFEIEGRSFRLQPVLSLPGDPRLMFLFSDLTSGRESFEGGRFLFADRPAGGMLVLDFNLSENPACALTPHVVCPVPPADTRLDLSIRAGERLWHRDSGQLTG